MAQTTFQPNWFSSSSGQSKCHQTLVSAVAACCRTAASCSHPSSWEPRVTSCAPFPFWNVCCPILSSPRNRSIEELHSPPNVSAQVATATTPRCPAAYIAPLPWATTGELLFLLKHPRWAIMHHSRHVLELQWVLAIASPPWTEHHSQSIIPTPGQRHFPYENKFKF
jgi:hypothetical protein